MQESISKINMETNKDEGSDFFGLYKDEIRSLKKNNVDKIDWFPSLRGQGSGSFPRVSRNLLYQQVGPHFGPRS